MNTTTLYAVYTDELHFPHRVSVEADLRSPWSLVTHYPFVCGISDKPKNIPTRDYFKDRTTAMYFLQRAQRLVKFANASGLHAVMTTKKHNQIPVPDWADHQSCWEDEFGKPLILIEPMEHAQSYISQLHPQQYTCQIVEGVLVPYHAPNGADRFGMLFTTYEQNDTLIKIGARLEIAATMLRGGNHER